MSRSYYSSEAMSHCDEISRCVRNDHSKMFILKTLQNETGNYD